MQTAAGVREKLSVWEMIMKLKMELQSRDYIYVVDLAKHVKALQKLISENSETLVDIYNLGTGKGSSVLEVVHALKKKKKPMM